MLAEHVYAFAPVRMNASLPYFSHFARCRAVAILTCALTTGAAAQSVEFDPDAMKLAFFPPTPPVFGAPIVDPADKPAYYRSRLLTAPQELGDYVNEFFYPALGTRITTGSGLDEKFTAKLEAYRAMRAALLNELVDELTVLETAAAATREQRLGSLAARQTPRIVTLEAEAEALRDELIRGRLWQRTVDWNEYRRWSLGVTRFPGDIASKEAEFQAIRAAAFYQRGLTPEQRGLVREIALDLEVKARVPRRNQAVRVGEEQDVFAMFFSPEMARVRLPPNVPAALRAKIGHYNQEKAALKRELRETIVEQDKRPVFLRTEAFAALAEKQWPQLSTLAELAEDIRREFAALPPPPPLAAPPRIPAELMERMERYERDRSAIMAAQNERVVQAVRRALAMPPSLSLEARRDWLENLPRIRADAVREAMQEFQQENLEAFAELKARFTAIHADLGVIASTYIDAKTGRPMTADTLQQNYLAALQQFDAFGREEVIYKHYKVALFQPGLSPEQRRLLFGMAVVGLARALPIAEPLPKGPMPIRSSS